MLPTYKLIKKDKKTRENANLTDYDKTYKQFSWKNAEKELAEVASHKLNIAHIAIDRHTQTFRKNKIALYFEGENSVKEQYTFTQMSNLSNKFANVLVDNGVKKGQRVFLFLPRIPELYIAFLGILKTGAIAGTMFSAFQEQALLDRLLNSKASILVTDALLLPRVQKILNKLPDLKKIIIVERGSDEKILKKIKLKKVIFYNQEMQKAKIEFRVRQMEKADSAFMLYTSGTTGKPKGVVHRHLAILQEYFTAKWVLDLKETDVYWCTADPGWVTGIAYGILGSWANGASSVVFGGRFDPDLWYKIIQDYKVSVWYTAPTAVRMLMAAKNISKKYNLASLRHLGSVGEPLNPEAVTWGLKELKLAFHDNWWQTELGAICIANYPCMDIKPGSMGKPFPGVIAGIVNDEGKELPAGKEGNLALRPSFPSIMKEIWMRPKKYKSYFLNNWYISGDRAWKDKDGYFWFIGRADDVIKTSGERVGPFEVESALVEHPDVIEAGVIGKPDPLRGEIIKAFVVLNKETKPSEKLKEELKDYVKKHLAGHAYPREVEFVTRLPKTRSGKIMRRVLKAKELGLPIGDTSTLEDY